ncbi:DUF3108 domain-containing protein [Flavobacterium davisii]|uniref:DUF3108 domain-containing protein n=1 Tax=Flavobacterium davisii TaxID=2906077 RepID=UPI00403FDB1C
MKRKLLLFIAVLGLSSFQIAEQKNEAFGVGEWLKYRIHYGIVNAGYATLELKDAIRNNRKCFYAVGHGYTTGMSRFFLKLKTIIKAFSTKKQTNLINIFEKLMKEDTLKIKRDFLIKLKIRFWLKIIKIKQKKSLSVTENVQDIVSSFYYLRNHPKASGLAVGESIIIDMFFDDEIYKFKMRFLGRETISTKFGEVKTLIFRPLVQHGRVFKEEESLTVWVSDDENKIPLRIKASLAVGSLKADLDNFKGLKNPFLIVKN